MNIANKITMIRMIMIPFFIFFMLSSGPVYALLALVFFVVASFTDFLDGYLARKLNLVTNFGKFMDPLADKLLVISALVCFVEIGTIPSWIVIIIIARELMISVFRAIAASSGIVLAASKWGKLKTVGQMSMIIILLLERWMVTISFPAVDLILIIVVTILTIVSGLDYVLKNKQVLSD